MLQEVAPGIYTYPGTGRDAMFRSSAIVADGEVLLIDPLPASPQVEQQLHDIGAVRAVVVTSGFHERAASAFARKFGVPMYAHPAALGHFEGSKDGYSQLPDTLPGGIEVLHTEGNTTGQVALYLPRDGGTLVVGDIWQWNEKADVPFFLRFFLEKVIGLRWGLHPMPPRRIANSTQFLDSLERMLDRPIERLLTPHGRNIASGAKDQLLARLTQGA